MYDLGLVSVIVPVYNIEKFLPNCLETIIRQSYKKLEIILVDDGSTDRSGIICDNFAAKDSRVVVFHHNKNLHQGAARNTGKANAHGEFIIFVDGDDYLHLDAIKCMYEAINRDSGYDMAIIDFKETNISDETIDETKCIGECVSLTQDDLMERFFIWTMLWNKLYRHKVIADIWSYDYEISEDVDFSFRSFLNIKKAIWIKQTLYYYVQRENSTLHKPGTKIVGAKCSIDLLYNNILSLPMEYVNYQHILLKKLYEKMIFLIGMTWNSAERQANIIKCKQYEKGVHKLFFHDPHFNSTQRFAYYVNIKYPYVIRVLKLLTRDRFSWSLLSKSGVLFQESTLNS
jgi:glycosyltransferase involved in cell wall biosynthesis